MLAIKNKRQVVATRDAAPINQHQVDAVWIIHVCTGGYWGNTFRIILLAQVGTAYWACWAGSLRPHSSPRPRPRRPLVDPLRRAGLSCTLCELAVPLRSCGHDVPAWREVWASEPGFSQDVEPGVVVRRGSQDSDARRRQRFCASSPWRKHVKCPPACVQPRAKPLSTAGLSCWPPPRSGHWPTLCWNCPWRGSMRAAAPSRLWESFWRTYAALNVPSSRLPAPTGERGQPSHQRSH